MPLAPHSEDVLLRVLSETYEAALDPDPWAPLLPKLVDFVGARSGMIGVTNPTPSTSSGVILHDLDPGLISRHSAEFGGLDPWVASYQRRHGPVARADGIWLRGPAYVDPAAVRKSAVGHEIFDPMGIGDLLTVGLSSRSPDHFNFFAAYLPSKMDPFSSDAIARFRKLAPHLVRASQIQKRVLLLSDRVRAADLALAHVPYGLFALGSDGRVLTMNPEAERILRANDGLTVRLGVLTAASPHSATLLSAATLRACALATGATSEPGAIVRVPRPSASRPYQVMVAPVPAASDRLSLSVRATVAIVIVSDPEASPRPAADVLRRSFDLTPRLAELAAALASGRTLAEYADEARLTVGTARVQLKELFARTGTSRQAELVRLLLTSLAVLRTKEGAR